MGSRFNRLTPTDLMFLRLETDEWPCHFGGLAVVEAGPLLDDSGKLRLEDIRRQLDDRLTRVPDLRQKVHFPVPLGGRPLWVDDDRFAIEHHVHTAPVTGGDEAAFLDAVAEVCERKLDRRRPLWELWFLTGRYDGRIGVLFKLHHAVADGLATVAIMGTLFDLEPEAPAPDRARWSPSPAPRAHELVVDNLAGWFGAMLRAVKSVVRLPRLAGSLRSFGRMSRGFFGSQGAGVSSINTVVRAGRRVRVLRLDLGRMKAVAHAGGGKVNDVVLTLWSGGIRRLLESRGETISNVDLVTGMATTLRPSTTAGDTIDNRVGTMVLRLPLSDGAATRRLATIIEHTAETKALWNPGATMGYLAALAGTPVGRYFVANQRASNTIVTNVIGPPVPVYLFGARVHDVIPIIELVGNIGLTLCAFSYAGEMFMAVTADATSFPDLDVLMDGMHDDWQVLLS